MPSIIAFKHTNQGREEMIIDLMKIKAAIAAYKTAIENSPHTEAEAMQAQRRIDQLRREEDGDLGSEKPAWVKNYLQVEHLRKVASRLVNAQHLVDHLDTLNRPLMHCSKRYVITDDILTSPAGFSVGEHVYFQTKIAIHTDNLSNIPESNVALRVYEVAKLED